MNVSPSLSLGIVPRIEDIRLTPVAFRDRPLLAASGMHEPWTARTIIEITCEGGHVGVSETYGDVATISELERVVPNLIGARITDLAGIEARIDRVLTATRAKGHQSSVISPRTDPTLRLARVFGAIEVACQDAFARFLGVPLSEVLGGRVRDRIPFSAYLFFKPAAHPGMENHDAWGEVLTPSQMVDLANTMIERHGFRSLKVKGGILDPELEVESIEALAAAFPTLPLRFDPNGNWTVETTLKFLKRFEATLEYLEDPVLGQEDMARIQAETDLPLATNMCVTGFAEIEPAIRRQAVKIVLADHHFWGGLDATKVLDRFCKELDIGLSMHSNTHLGISLMAMAHVTAACPNLNHDCDTHYSWMDDDVVQGGVIQFDSGAIRLTDAPGLGVEIDQDVLARMSADYVAHGPTHRDDTIFIRKLWPDWDDARPRF